MVGEVRTSPQVRIGKPAVLIDGPLADQVGDNDGCRVRKQRRYSVEERLVHLLRKYRRHRPEIESTQCPGHDPDQCDRRRTHCQADQLQISCSWHAPGMVQLEAKSSECQIGVLMRLHLKTNRATQQNVELVQIVAYGPA